MTAPTLSQTIAFVRSAFANVTDKGRQPYAEHCIRVMERLPADATEDERRAALLHDVLEDLPVLASDLRDMGYSPRTIWLVAQLTRDEEEESYCDYIRRIKATGDAGLIAIKLADLADNLDFERLLRLQYNRRETFKRRYESARRALME